MSLQDQERAGWLSTAIERITCPTCNFEKEEEGESCWNEACKEFALRGIVPAEPTAAVKSAAAQLPVLADELSSRTMSHFGGLVPSESARLAQKMSVGPAQHAVFYSLIGSSDVRRG